MSVQTAWPFHPERSAEEVADLLDSVKALLIPFIEAGAHAGPAGTAAPLNPIINGHTSVYGHFATNGSTNGHSAANGKNVTNGNDSSNGTAAKVKSRAMTEGLNPEELRDILKLDLPEQGLGKEGLLKLLETTLKYSVNTWDQGFMDKLFNSTNAVGVIAELVLAVLNTNSHVYAVSPFLTLAEKHITERLAALIGFPSSTSGGIAQPGGSASNSSSIVIARNALYPDTKTGGINGRCFTLFTSAHGHYSIEKAAQCFGFGSKQVITVPVDDRGRIIPSELDRLVQESKDRGETPFYINATAGTTVLGSYDPFEEISKVAKKHGIWMHIDGSWGGAVLFSDKYKASRLQGMELADSVAITPHKMLAVPVTSSFLIVKDMKNTHRAMTLPAGYLFHDTGSEEIFDLAELTPQCGRKGDAFKLFLSWSYYGSAYLGKAIEQGYERANYLLSLLQQHNTSATGPSFKVVSPKDLPCWQVCFYYVPAGSTVDARSNEENTKLTARIVHGLHRRGFMVDYAPGEWGKHFRVVVHPHKTEATLELLVKDILELGAE